MAAQIYLSAAHTLRECDNAVLLELAGRGDQLAWERLIEMYDGLVRSVARSFRLQQVDVSDVVQTTWLRLLQKLHTIRDPERLAGWLAITTTRECLALVRKNSTLRLDEAMDERADPAADPESSVFDHDTAQEVWAAVADLPPRQRRIITALFREETDSYHAVAKKCAMPIGSIGPTRARALMRLRARLTEKGMGPLDL
jgi:RNA polymerase sigma factor (sigma-70 family)